MKSFRHKVAVANCKATTKLYPQFKLIDWYKWFHSLYLDLTEHFLATEVNGYNDITSLLIGSHSLRLKRL